MNNVFDVTGELNKLLERNGLSVTTREYDTIVDIYSATTREQSKQYYNYTSKVGLLEGILQQVKQGESAEDVYQTFSDVRHYELYENFMGNSERRRMVNELRKRGIPLDVLKGVGIDTEGDILKPRPNIEVRYKFEKGEDVSLYLEYFEIVELLDDGEEDTIFQYENDDYEFDEPDEERMAPREVEGRKSRYAGRITNTAYGDVKIWIDKNGRTTYRDSRGHLVKVRDGEVQERIIFEEE